VYCSTGFEKLISEFLEEFRKLNYGDTTSWFKPFFDSDVLLHFPTMDDLFKSLKSSPVFNYLNPKPLKYLASKSGISKLSDSVRNYEEIYLSGMLQDFLPTMKEVEVVGKKISKQASKSITAAITKQDITISQLQHMFIPRLSNNKLTLDCGLHSAKFYFSYKVCIMQQ